MRLPIAGSLIPSVVALVASVWLVPCRPACAELEFGIPTPMTSPLNDAGGYAWPHLSADELTAYYGSSRPGAGGFTDIYVSTRASLTEDWQSPVQLGPTVNTGLTEGGPTVRGDGLEMYFYRTTDPFTNFDGNLFATRRGAVSDPWGPAEPFAFNSAGRDAIPHISSDGLKLYFDSDRPQNETPVGINTWVSSRSSILEPFAEPELFFGGGGYVTDDGLTHVLFGGPTFAENYGVPNVGGDDIYFRTRADVAEDFGPLVNPGSPLNSSLLPFDCCAILPGSKSTLYFTSTRPGAPSDGVAGFVNLWQAPIAEAISVDIKPGSATTPVNLKSKGKLPVAILSTEDFDATLVDADTLLFGDPLLIANGETPVSPLRWALEDVNDDDLVDLTLKFSMREIVGNGVMGPLTTEGYLAGQTFDGTQVAGREFVEIVPGKGKSVPEPAGGWLLVLGWICLAVRWDRRRIAPR